MEGDGEFETNHSLKPVESRIFPGKHFTDFRKSAKFGWKCGFAFFGLSQTLPQVIVPAQ
jgi:hypothetical protein